MTFLYHIHRPEDYGDFTTGYIGVTDNPKERFKRHIKGQSGAPILKRAFEKYSDLVMTLVSEGDRNQMLDLEKYFRPEPKGWNCVAGGGDPPSRVGVAQLEAQKRKIGESNKKIQLEKSSHIWICENKVFLSKKDAADFFNITRKTVRDRALNPNFENWYIERKR